MEPLSRLKHNALPPLPRRPPMFLITKFLSALVLPPFGLIALAVAGLWVGRRRHSVGHIMTMLALISMLALSVPIVSDGLSGSLEKFPALSQESLSRAEATHAILATPVPGRTSLSQPASEYLL